MTNHISYSGLTRYLFCPYSYKIRYIDGIKSEGSIFTAFGQSIHATCQNLLLKKITDSKKFFSENFESEIKKLSESYVNNILFPKDKREKALNITLQDMKNKGPVLSDLAVKSLQQKFGDYEVVSVEEEIREPITTYDHADFDFNGFIDLIIKTKDGKYHIIDWKTTSWGWLAEKKTDKLTTYQLTYYKHFYTLINNLDRENTHTWFALIKRTAFKKDKKTKLEVPKDNVIEFVSVSNGTRKINNSLNVLNNVVYNIDHKRFIKNKTNCSKCEWNKTKWCP